MSRRDTIIIAALLNAGLLVVLFTTALKTDTHPPAVAAAEGLLDSKKVIEIQTRKEPLIKPQGDEVDQVLRDYGNTQSLTPSSATALSFVDEINAITQPALETSKAKAMTSIEVVVAKGDVLEKIAKTHHTTVEEIMKQNNLTNSNLRIGQVLKITPKSGFSSVIAKAETSQASGSESTGKYYTVKSGDNPWTIAVKNHMKVDELLKLNNLDAEKARRLKPGDQLRIK
ncbi:MAG: LysM peptidoglycan-binding domain-containing protein [Chlamydiota bacterium]